MKQPIKKQFFKKDAKESGAYRWADLPVKDYPAAGTRSQGMTKQVLFDADEHLLSELRYFEAEPGGYSALERHDHIHAVLILRGHGKVLMGDHIEDVAQYDTLYIHPRRGTSFTPPKTPTSAFCASSTANATDPPDQPKPTSPNCKKTPPSPISSGGKSRRIPLSPYISKLNFVPQSYVPQPPGQPGSGAKTKPHRPSLSDRTAMISAFVAAGSKRRSAAASILSVLRQLRTSSSSASDSVNRRESCRVRSAA